MKKNVISHCSAALVFLILVSLMSCSNNETPGNLTTGKNTSENAGSPPQQTAPASVAQIGQKCALADSCVKYNCDTCDDLILDCHAITQIVADQMMADLPPTAPTTPHGYSYQYIKQLIGDTDCHKFTIEIEADLVPKIIPKASKFVDPRFYSISLLRAVLRKNASHLVFYNAIKQGQPDVIFSAFYDKKTNFFDLSGSIPPLQNF